MRQKGTGARALRAAQEAAVSITSPELVGERRDEGLLIRELAT